MDDLVTELKELHITDPSIPEDEKSYHGFNNTIYGGQQNMSTGDTTHTGSGDQHNYGGVGVINQSGFSQHFHAAQPISTDQEKAQKCHQGYKTSTYEEFKNRNPTRAPGTCQWVFKHPSYLNWTRSDHDDLLWISADPGCGKSVLARSLADHYLDSKNYTTCYFFFKEDNPLQQGLDTTLCAMLHQLFSQHPNLIRHALPAWERNGTKLCNEVEEMWRIFVQAAATAGPVVCVFDALDECQDADRSRLISLLLGVLRGQSKTLAPGCLKILATSRPYDSVGKWFEEAASRDPHIHLRGEAKNEQIREKINMVIEERMKSMALKFRLNSIGRRQLTRQLVDMQHRTYLWLYLALDEIRQTLRSSRDPNTVIIRSLPSSVPDAYDRILRKIPEEDVSSARQVLLIIIGARRPFSVGEMAWALSAADAHHYKKGSLQEYDEGHLTARIAQ
ncbi:hypothetical protein LTR66_017961, partial [Elasticomyces elasticus]